MSLSALLAFSNHAAASEKAAPVSGFARSFLLGTELSDATITVLETGLKLKTDEHGRFGPFLYPVGKPLTMVFNKWGYKTTQSDTVIVPKEGLTGPHNNITFQIPAIETFYMLDLIIGANLDDEKCHVVTTIIANGKTLNDVPQGEENAKLVLSPAVNEPVFYFGIFKDGMFKGKTNPFPKGLTAATEDGGAGFANLPPRDEPYTITAIKDGKKFSSAQFICRKGAFINISPPRGPMVLE